MATAKADAPPTTSSDDFPSVWDDSWGRHRPDPAAFEYHEPPDPPHINRHPYWHKGPCVRIYAIAVSDSR